MSMRLGVRVNAHSAVPDETEPLRTLLGPILARKPAPEVKKVRIGVEKNNDENGWTLNCNE